MTGKEIAMHDPPFDLDELKTELDEYGFVVLHNLIPAEQAQHMADRLMDIMNRQPDAEKLYQHHDLRRGSLAAGGTLSSEWPGLQRSAGAGL